MNINPHNSVQFAMRFARFRPSRHSEFSSESHRQTKKAFKPAFSLIEMLMALLVASLLMAALAPVMIKKSKENVSLTGEVNAPKVKTVYLTDIGTHDWTIPQGVTDFTVTTVGAGGGGGAGMSYGCVVFTTTEVAQNSILPDDSYCSHARGDGNINFTLPEGVEEIYVSMLAGAGGGGAGRAQLATDVNYDAPGSYNWTVPEIVKGNRVLVKLLGAGGGGGGSNQGGGGGGASGGWVNWTSYSVASNRTTIPVVVGGGGAPGNYGGEIGSPGAGGSGFVRGSNGTIAGGGGGGSSAFDASLTAYGGGGGASPWNSWAGWFDQGGVLWQTVFNNGGNGTTGGSSGPSGGLGGKNGGDGATGGGVARGGQGVNGTVGADGLAFGAARGGTGGTVSLSAGTGAGGSGQDFPCGSPNSLTAGGGAGGGGGGSALSAGANAPNGCRGPGPDYAAKTLIAKAGTGAGGAGASCGYNVGGVSIGGVGGDGTVRIKYLTIANGGGGGQAGVVLPRSRVSLNSTVRAGQAVTVNVGKGGIGGDAMVIFPNGDNAEIRTINSSGTVSGSTDLSPANGSAGSESTMLFGASFLARTGLAGQGRSYNGSSWTSGGATDGTRTISGGMKSADGNWHAWQGTPGGYMATEGSATQGGAGCPVSFDSVSYSTSSGGILSSKNGANGGIGLGGSGGYATGRGGKGGDGYVKIEWGIPRNINKTASVKYSGGGGSAGETISNVKVSVSPLTKTIKYTVGTGGAGALYNTTTSKITNGLNGGSTVFGVDLPFASSTTAKGGLGGNSISIQSTVDASIAITALTGSNGLGGLKNCTNAIICPDELLGKAGTDGKGGKGGASSTGAGANGGTSTSADGQNAANFDGATGGGTGGGGGAASPNNYGKGGKGADGYIKVQWYE